MLLGLIPIAIGTGRACLRKYDWAAAGKYVDANFKSPLTKVWGFFLPFFLIK